MTDTVLSRIAGLKTATTAELKQQWRALFDTAPPIYNRRVIEFRLTHRLQELAYGGLKPATIERLEAIGDQFDDGSSAKRRSPVHGQMVRGTQLVREYQGVEHRVTVRDHDFEYQGRPYKSLSAIARAITGVRWNGPLFFGLKKFGERA